MRNKVMKTTVPGHAMAVKVLGSRPNDIEYALRIWKRKVKDSGIIESVKENMEYEKPTTKKRRLKNTAIRNKNKSYG